MKYTLKTLLAAASLFLYSGNSLAQLNEKSSDAFSLPVSETLEKTVSLNAISYDRDSYAQAAMISVNGGKPVMIIRNQEAKIDYVYLHLLRFHKGINNKEVATLWIKDMAPEFLDTHAYLEDKIIAKRTEYMKMLEVGETYVLSEVEFLGEKIEITEVVDAEPEVVEEGIEEENLVNEISNEDNEEENVQRSEEEKSEDSELSEEEALLQRYKYWKNK